MRRACRVGGKARVKATGAESEQPGMIEFFAGMMVAALSVALACVTAIALRRRASRGVRTEAHVLAERVRSVGRLVGLEVSAKEIATASEGLSWLPPLVLTPAKVAMIFQFEREYAVELAGLGEERVRRVGSGWYRLRLPEPTATTRLAGMTPYDIQNGRVLGLVDVLPVNADRQKALMDEARRQAERVFDGAEDGYRARAKAAIEGQLEALLALFGVEVEVEWEGDGPAPLREVVGRLPSLALAAV